MDLGVASLLGSGLGFLGSLFGGSSAKAAQASANRTNIMLNRENRDWMEKMANSEMQRGVQDYQAAGLNPMLALSRGGAPTPQNSAATVMPTDAMGKAITSASGQLAQANLGQMLANINLTQESARNVGAQADINKTISSYTSQRQAAEIVEIKQRIKSGMAGEQLTDAQRNQIEKMLPELLKLNAAQIQQAQQQTSSGAAQQKLTEAELPGAQAEAKMWEMLSKQQGASVSADVWMRILQIIRQVTR